MEILWTMEYTTKDPNLQRSSSTLWFQDMITRRIRPFSIRRYSRARIIQASMSSPCPKYKRLRSLLMKFVSKLTSQCLRGKTQLLDLLALINGFWTQIQSIYRFRAQNSAMGPSSTFEPEVQHCWLLPNSSSSSKSKLTSATTKTSIQTNPFPQLASSSTKTSPSTNNSCARAVQSTDTVWYACSRRSQPSQRTIATHR